jgi:hypothetical protein
MFSRATVLQLQGRRPVILLFLRLLLWECVPFFQEYRAGSCSITTN